MTDASISKTDEASDMKKTKSSGLMMVNNLNYNLPSNLSVVVRRALIKSYFNKTTYTNNETATVILNGGDLYCDGLNSYITFKLGIDMSATVDNTVSRPTFGNGSACNIFRSITATTASGTEIERVENVSCLRRIVDNYDCSLDWFDTFGSVMGYPYSSFTSANGGLAPSAIGVGYDYKTTAPTAPETNTIKTFVIPLNRILGLFNSRKLLPSLVASGLRLDFRFNDYNEVFYDDGSAPVASTSYTITDPSIMLDSYQLSDAVLKELNMIAAKNSLEVVYESWDHTRDNVASSNFNVDSKKAVSRAQGVFAITRLDADVNSLTKDSCSPEAWAVDNYQYNLGGWRNLAHKNDFEKNLSLVSCC
jgi:hypothetical protein